MRLQHDHRLRRRLRHARDHHGTVQLAEEGFDGVVAFAFAVEGKIGDGVASIGDLQQVVQHGCGRPADALVKVGDFVVTVGRDGIERRCEAGVRARPLKHNRGLTLDDLRRLT